MVLKTTQYNIRINIPVWLEKLIIKPLLLYRFIRHGYTFRRIPLTQGKFAVVDPADFYHLNRHKWRICKGKNTLYAERSVRLSFGRYTRILMHRQILNAYPNHHPRFTSHEPLFTNLVIDHINRNGLDNRRSNLRLATIAQNAWNSRIRPNRSGYKGVWFAKDKGKFRAAIWHNNKRIYLGYFDSPRQAALAYDTAAKKYHKDFAVLNFDK
jgi:hypothetical protein